MAITVTHQAGLRFAAQVGAHALILDQPVRGGGEDAGPSPIELLGAALGSCIALYVHRFLVARNLSTEGLRVEVSEHSTSNPHRIAQFDAHVVLPDDVPELYRPMIEAVARVCPVHNALEHGAGVRLFVETGRLVTPGVGETLTGFQASG
jgi:putative redox protein